MIEMDNEWAVSKAIIKVDLEKCKKEEGKETIKRKVATLSVNKSPLFLVMIDPTQPYALTLARK